MRFLQKIKEKLKEYIEKRYPYNSSMIIENWDLLSREEYETLPPEEIKRREDEQIKILRAKIEELGKKDKEYEKEKEKVTKKKKR